ncbi:hypothetical protein ACFQH6_08190 [Halobacteriaceae archaeon GCM10025711]
MAGSHQDDSTGKTGITDSESGKDGLITRRSYVKLFGAALAGAAGTGLASKADAQEYRVIEVPANTKEVVLSVGSGETVENVLIDNSAPGAAGRIACRGSDWTLRNVGIKGRVTDRQGEDFATIIPQVDAGSTGVIENLYMGDGAEGKSNMTGMWVDAKNHEGTLKLRNINVGHWSDNGLYGSGPGVYDDYGMGEVHIESCYAHNNNISGFRIGTPGSYVKDSVVVNDGDIPSEGRGLVNARGIWAKEQDGLQATGCDVNASGHIAVQASDKGQLTMKNCRLNGDIVGADAISGSSTGSPDPTPPSGVPMSAEEAASGNVSTAGDDTSSPPTDDQQDSTALPNVLSVEGGSPDQVATYAFTVGGDVEKSTDRGASINDEDTIDGSTVEGAVAGGTDSFRFSGDLQDLSTDGSPTVYLNGEQIDPADYGDKASLPNVVSIDGTGTRADYRFAVGGDIEKSTARGASINDGDTIDGSTVEGAVAGGIDSFAFSGSITEFAFTVGSATLYVNDQQVNPADLGTSDSASEPLPNTLVIDGSQTDGITEYTVEVSGDVAKSTLDGASINDGDTIDGSSVSGSVSTGADAFEFSGFVRSLDLTGGADVTVDYGAN